MADRELSPAIVERFLQACRHITADRVKGVTTMGELAEMVNEFPQNFSKMMNGTRYPTLDTIALLCREFGVDANWIMIGEGRIFRGDTEADEIIRTLKRIERKLGPEKTVKKVK